MKFVPILAFTALLAPAALAAPRTVTITDSLGLNWQDELVHYPLNFKDGEFKGDPTVRVEANGKALISQVSDIDRYADGSVKSCNAWFVANVPANASVAYTLTPGAAGPATDLVEASSAADIISLTTKAADPIGIRLLGGTKTFTPMALASTVPGPINALLLPSGKTIGQGRLEVPFRVKSYSSELLARGPLFAEARVRYQFDNGYWDFTAKVAANCPTVVIHEELNTGYSDQLAADADRLYTLTLKGNGFAPTQFFYTGHNDKPELTTIVKEGIRPEWAAFQIPGNWFASAVQGGPIPAGAAQTLAYTSGYPSVQPRLGTIAEVQETNGDAVGLTGLDTEYWRQPLSIRLRTTAGGDIQFAFPLQAYHQQWAIDGFGHNSPNYTGETLGVPENTVRRAYGIVLGKSADQKTEMLQDLFTQASRLNALPLDKVKDMTLNWPDPMASAAWAPESSAAGKAAVAAMRERLEVTRTLGQWARFSMAYHFGFSKREYPDISKVMNSTADLSAADRATLRHLAAWNAYDMNSTDTFPFGMGFHLNNPNMSIMAIEARVKSSLLVKDNPMFKGWGEWSRTFLIDYNKRFTRPMGALYENPHYSLGVTLDWMAQANKILMDEGIGDALDTPLMPKAMRFMMNWVTPPDARFNGHRVILPIGNCSYQSVPPTMATQYVTYYKDRNPELAGQLQWMANQTYPADKQLTITKDIVPPLGSIEYPNYGVFMRNGFGTPYETLMFLFAGNCDGHAEWESDQMGYTLYAKGQPINLSFGNGYFPIFGRPWLRNRVSINHEFEESERNPTKVTASAFAPAMEYAHATRGIDSIRPLKTEYPLLKGSAWTPEESLSWPTMPVYEHIPMTIWHRQIVYMKDTDPKGPNYFVLRDGFDGKPTKPTDLSLWFLANTMTRQDNVFHFDGQVKVDMDVFVASPTAAQPETGTYGHVQQPYERLTGFDPKFFPNGKRAENQLFLRLKQPVGKGYLVVLYPRLKEGDPAANFTYLTENAVKVETPLSTDYVFVNHLPSMFKDKSVNFTGTAGSVRFYKDGKTVVTNAEGKGQYQVAGKTISGEGPFTVTLANGKATLAAGGTATIK